MFILAPFKEKKSEIKDSLNDRFRYRIPATSPEVLAIIESLYYLQTDQKSTLVPLIWSFCLKLLLIHVTY